MQLLRLVDEHHDVVDLVDVNCRLLLLDLDEFLLFRLGLLGPVLHHRMERFYHGRGLVW